MTRFLPVALVIWLLSLAGAIEITRAFTFPPPPDPWHVLMKSPDWNRRGFIGCEAGWLVTRNIDFINLPPPGVRFPADPNNYCATGGAPT